MKLVILDAFAANPGDLSWDFLREYGELTVYDRTPAEKILERCKDADIVIINKTPMRKNTVEALPRLKCIAVLATGYNVVDVDCCRQRGIDVVNIPSYSVSAVAQQTFAFILEYCNRIGQHSASVLSGEWASNPDFSYQVAPLYELKDKTIGIIGYGRIGQRVAQLAKALEMRVLVHTAHPQKYPNAPVEFMSLEKMLPLCDFVTLHTPLTPATEKLVNKEFIGKMKKGAFLVNTSRGQELDPAAVADALNSGILSGAGVDVLETEPPKSTDPLLSAKNIFITPHIAWASFDTRKRLMGILEQNIKAFVAGSPINVVNK